MAASPPRVETVLLGLGAGLALAGWFFYARNVGANRHTGGSSITIAELVEASDPVPNLFPNLPSAARVLRFGRLVYPDKLGVGVDSEIDGFYERLERLEEKLCPSGSAQPAPPPSPGVVVIEGLDGTGKSTAAKKLAERLGATYYTTPPQSMAKIRRCFDSFSGTPIARAFYMASNYIAADEMVTEAAAASVSARNGENGPDGDDRISFVVDRFFHSTCAYTVGKSTFSSEELDALESSGVFTWPSDLLRPDCVIVLQAAEEVRLRRVERRAALEAAEAAKTGALPSNNSWEERLRKSPELGQRINAALLRFVGGWGVYCCDFRTTSYHSWRLLLMFRLSKHT